MSERIIKINSIRIRRNSRTRKDETIAVEAALQLSVNGKHLKSFVHSSGHEEELVIGHLLSTKIARSTKEVELIEWDNEEICNVVVNGIDDTSLLESSQGFALSRNRLKDILSSMREKQVLHKMTRCFHAALLWDTKTGTFFMTEDISRHCAVDKVIGHGAKNQYEFSQSVLFTSGRLVSTIVSKCINVRVPAIVSLTVATDRGIQLARESGVTIIGSISEEGFWLYNEGQVRIETDNTD